ncbi:MAG: hypothetical protein M3N26_00410 [Pseudomonadota bacterium]|nr:hypothetical protein [Pseudomonadota bacterium]
MGDTIDLDHVAAYRMSRCVLPVSVGSGHVTYDDYLEAFIEPPQSSPISSSAIFPAATRSETRRSRAVRPCNCLAAMTWGMPLPSEFGKKCCGSQHGAAKPEGVSRNTANGVRLVSLWKIPSPIGSDGQQHRRDPDHPSAEHEHGSPLPARADDTGLAKAKAAWRGNARGTVV